MALGRDLGDIGDLLKTIEDSKIRRLCPKTSVFGQMGMPVQRSREFSVFQSWRRKGFWAG
jgi:hypothetical protein